MCLSSFLACSSFLCVPLAAQGRVWTVDDGPNSYGSAWLCDLNPDGSVDSVSVAPTPDPVSDFDGFGSCATAIGDLDGNGVPDLVVGAPGDDRAGLDCGALWLLYRAPGGGLAKRIPIRPFVSFGPRAIASPSLSFGGAVASLGDLDGDGTLEVAVGAIGNAQNSPPDKGNVWVLSLASDGAVARYRALAVGALAQTLVQGEHFGSSLTTLGDFDGDGVTDLAVGSDGTYGGHIRVVRLRTTGAYRQVTLIGNVAGGFPLLLDEDDMFGSSIAALGDLNGDGVGDLAVGAPGDIEPSSDSGAVWILFLNPNGTVLAYQKINEIVGGLGSHTHRRFGESLAALGDLNGDTIPDLAVGASGASGADSGAVFVLFLNADGTVQSSRILTTEFTGLASGDGLGSALANLGDWDGDGRPDLAVGAFLRDGAPTSPDFTDVHAAVAAALSGDTVLIRGGAYATSIFNPLTVDGKSLTIQAWNPGNAKMGHVVVWNLSASQQVRLSGLRLGFSSSGRLILEANQGRVWIDDCHIEHPASFITQFPSAIQVTDCASIVLNRTVATGGRTTSSGTPGLETSGGSRVHAYDCSFIGGLGDSGPPYMYYDRQAGGPGIRVSSPDDFLFLSGCLAEGSGPFWNGQCDEVAPGIETVGTVHALDSIFQRRLDNILCGGVTISGTVDIVPGQALSLVINNPTRENEQTQFAIEGPPDSLVVMRYSLVSGAHFRRAHRGTDLLGGFPTSEVIGVIGSDGTLHWSDNLGFLPPGYSILRFFAQAALVPSRSSLTPGAKPTALPSPLPLYPGSAVGMSRLSGDL